MEDILLQKFFEPWRWEVAINRAVEKGIDKTLLRELSVPDTRLHLYRAIRKGTYVVAPPHEAQIPKDDGSMRTVYVNEGIDRVILSIVNDMLFELCPELIHPRCGSYQKGIGCGKLVKEMSARIHQIDVQAIGVKVDLSKYFDSVRREYIDAVFDYVKNKFGKSALMAAVRLYYHTDTVIDMDKHIVEKYSSLRQGCAVAAFLADSVLYDIDEEVSSFDVDYIRYSDDILIVGKEWETAFARMSEMVAEKGLVLNPKKVEKLYKDRWFTFLGFQVKDDKITLSPGRIKSFQKEIEARTVKKPERPLKQVMADVTDYLYKGNGRYSWATSVLPIVNVEKDLMTLDSFTMDAIRAGSLGKHRIGGLGSVKDRPDHTVLRGPGKNVKSNREKIRILPGWNTLKCMQNAMLVSQEAYRTLAMSS